jgi:two-component system chemotaxis response regulator CheY
MSSGRILIVDDNVHVRQVIRLALSKAGYEVLEAGDGGEAIEMLQKGNTAETIHTIICDLQMPHVDGGQAISFFHAQFPDIPLIVLTGAPDFVLTEVLQKEGIGAYLQKPVSDRKLLEVVRQTVRLRDLRLKSG